MTKDTDKSIGRYSRARLVRAAIMLGLWAALCYPINELLDFLLGEGGGSPGRVFILGAVATLIDFLLAED
jgi:hypothetical protein